MAPIATSAFPFPLVVWLVLSAAGGGSGCGCGAEGRKKRRVGCCEALLCRPVNKGKIVLGRIKTGRRAGAAVAVRAGGGERLRAPNWRPACPSGAPAIPTPPAERGWCSGRATQARQVLTPSWCVCLYGSLGHPGMTGDRRAGPVASPGTGCPVLGRHCRVARLCTFLSL